MRLQTGQKRILVIPDLQIPFHHKDAFEFLDAVYYDRECDTVVCVGDEVDQYALSRYVKDPEAWSAGQEHKEAKKHLDVLYRIFPEVEVCTSNHTDRILKRAMDAGIPRAYLKGIREFMGAPETWSWNPFVDVDGVRFEHGDGAGGLSPHRNLAIANRQSTVIGHHHQLAAVDYVANNKETIFGMVVGCLCDISTYAFDYTRLSKHKPILSCGVVLNGVPQVIPMITNKRGRWTGVLM